MGGSPQKQTPWQDFKCKSCMGEVTLGITRGGEGKRDKDGRKVIRLISTVGSGTCPPSRGGARVAGFPSDSKGAGVSICQPLSVWMLLEPMDPPASLACRVAGKLAPEARQNSLSAECRSWQVALFPMWKNDKVGRCWRQVSWCVGDRTEYPQARLHHVCNPGTKTDSWGS